MNAQQNREIVLELDLAPEMIPIFQAFVEKAAIAFGMQEKDALALTLASEEVFSYLCSNSKVTDSIKITCQNGGYYVQINFIFPNRDLNLRAFNLTTNIIPDDENQLNEIGLLIAARTVDRLYFNNEQVNSMRLSLYKEKGYPLTDIKETTIMKNPTGFSLAKAEPEDIKSFCRNIPGVYKTHLFPSFLGYPGKLIDMVNSGDYHVALAFDQQHNVIGGIVWQSEANKTVEFFGPYLFAEVSGMAEALTDYCLEQIGRSDAAGIMTRCGTPDLNVQFFEELGTTSYYSTDSTPVQRTAYYRQLWEDPGNRIWTHPDLLAYLQTEYQRLFLPRDIRPTTNMGEQSNRYSVFSTEFDQKQVVVRPLLGGTDADENLSQHLKLFTSEQILDVFFEIDLGIAWQSELIPALLKNHFYPRLILPWAGKADLLLFQYQAGEIA